MDKEQKKYIFTVLGAILLIGTLVFYWYELRPSQIKKKCDGDAREKVVRLSVLENLFGDEEYQQLSDKDKERFEQLFNEKLEENKEMINAAAVTDKDYTKFYEACLLERGF